MPNKDLPDPLKGVADMLSQMGAEAAVEAPPDPRKETPVEAVETPTRLYSRGASRRKNTARLQVDLTSIECRMLERVRDHYDIPFTVLVRMWIRQNYRDLYGNIPDASPTPTGL